MNKYKPSLTHLTQYSQAVGLYDDEIEKEVNPVTSNITISYKGYEAVVIEPRNSDVEWYAIYTDNHTVITAYGSSFDELKKEYAISIDDYLNWVAEEQV